MARVLPSEVTAICPTTRDVMPFILTASTLIAQHLAESTYSEALLTEIEKWWAAHLIACVEPLVIAKSLGDTALRFQSPKLGMGLQATPYGQQVLLLDTDGLLGGVRSIPILRT